MTPRDAVLASEVYVHRPTYPTEGDVAKACAEVRATGLRTFNDIVILAYASHFGILNDADEAMLQASNVSGLIKPQLVHRPGVAVSDIRRMLRAPGHGGGDHKGIDADDGRMMLVFDLFAKHVRSLLSDLATAADPSFAFIRWALIFEAQDRRTHSAVVDALMKCGSDSAAIAAGAMLARAGGAYVNHEPPRFTARVPRTGDLSVRMRVLGTILVSLTPPRRGSITSTRWLRYTGMLHAILRLSLVSAAAVEALKASDDALSERVLTGYAIMSASAGGKLAAIARGFNVLSGMFGPLESLSEQDRYVSAQHLDAAAKIVQSIPLTAARFRRYAETIQCDRLTRAISLHDYDFERARLIKLVAIALTVNDAALRADVLGVVTTLAGLPPGHIDALPEGFCDRYPIVEGFGTPKQ